MAPKFGAIFFTQETCQLTIIFLASHLLLKEWLPDNSGANKSKQQKQLFSSPVLSPGQRRGFFSFGA